MEVREIPGYGGRYLVSEDGAVFSTINTRGNRLPSARRLAARRTSLGYIDVQLRMNGKNEHPLVHVLVGLAFIGPREGREINHKDGNKANNHVSNLEYVTRKQNVDHALRNGLRQTARGERIKRSRVKEELVPQIRDEVARLRANGRAPHGSMARLAKKYGVSPSALDHVARGDCWKHVGDVQ